jgi:hypothetical protein
VMRMVHGILPGSAGGSASNSQLSAPVIKWPMVQPRYTFVRLCVRHSPPHEAISCFFEAGLDGPGTGLLWRSSCLQRGGEGQMFRGPWALKKPKGTENNRSSGDLGLLQALNLPWPASEPRFLSYHWITAAGRTHNWGLFKEKTQE